MNQSLRPTRPITLISLVFFALSAVSAMYLMRRHQDVSEETQKAMAAWRVANEIEESVNDLLDLEMANVEAVGPIHRRIDTHLADARQEITFPGTTSHAFQQFEDGYKRYREAWESVAQSGPEHRLQVGAAMIILDKQTLVWARRLESELHDHVQTTSGQQQRLWTDLGLGLAAVGATGGIGGMLLGFATASSMRRSILQLQVRLQDAAGKLGQDLPQFEWQFQGSLERIEEQFSILDQHIEDVVNRLQQRERDVMRADQLAKLGRVAAGVAHEIRNPLTAIKLLVQSSLETRMPPDKDDLVVIESEIRRMEASLNSMLDYARSARPEKSAVAPQPFIEGVADLVRNQAARQGVTLDCPVSYPDATVLADPGQIKQVLLNLALNALDAMPRGGKIQFDIDATPTTVNIYVTDNGPGVDKHFMTNMFEPFASTKETGVGLGLALSKRIVEDHGGQLTGENLPECGARFTVTLPRGDIMRGNVADDTRESELDQREETTHS